MTSLVNCNRIISELIILLKADIKQIRAGDYLKIKQSSDLKTEKIGTLFSTLKEFAKSENFHQGKAKLQNQLMALNALGAQYSKLLLAVTNGIKSANQRIYRLRNTHTQVGVYGQKGRSLTFLEDASENEKKF